jgi:YbbR-like protein
MSKRPSFIRRFLKDRDRNAILICVAIAIAFWLTDALSHPYTHDYNFTLDYELQDNVSFASAPRANIKARLSGQGWELLKASIKRKFNYVPVSVLRPEITRSDLIAAVYQHLSDYEIVVREVDIDVMTLDINMVISRSIPIQLDATADIAPGFVFKDSLHLSPSNVTVTGPSSLVERLGPVKIEATSIESLTTNLDQVVNVILPDLEYISIEPKQVHLVAEVEKVVQMTTTLPLLISGDTAGLSFVPETINLSYSLGESFANATELNRISAVAIVSAKDIDTGKAQIELIDMPDFIGNIKIRPDSVTIISGKQD